MDLFFDLFLREPQSTRPDPQTECDIIKHGHVTEKRVMLEHESHAPVLDFTARNIITEEEYLPAGFTPHGHVYPRAYCIAKPATGCAVFVYPAIDSQIPSESRLPNQWGGTIISGRELTIPVNVGEWVTIVYAVSEHCSAPFAIPPVKQPWKLYGKAGK